jgi:hypothetical protein
VVVHVLKLVGLHVLGIVMGAQDVDLDVLVDVMVALDVVHHAKINAVDVQQLADQDVLLDAVDVRGIVILHVLLDAQLTVQLDAQQVVQRIVVQSVVEDAPVIVVLVVV